MTGDLLLTNVRPYDTETGEVGAPTDLVVRDGVLAGSGGGTTDTAGLTRVDGRGGTVLPGLIDAHFHAYAIAMDGLTISAVPMSLLALNAARRLEDALRRGFTTIRDVAGGDIGLRQAGQRGLFPSPDYFFTGPALSQTAGHGDERPGDLGLHTHDTRMGIVVDGVDAVRAAARERFRTGAHAIKIMAGGGVASPTDRIEFAQYSEAEIAAICAEAARRGSYVCAHAYVPAAIRPAVLNGVTCIEHGNLLDAETAALMAEHGAFLVPTLASYEALDRRGPEAGLDEFGHAKNKVVLDRGKDAVRLAYAAGVRVGWGSDLMGDLEDEQLAGLRLQAEASSVAQTVHAATAVNAELMGLTDRGSLADGLRGDLLVLPGDLAERPELLWGTDRLVIRGGRVVRGFDPEAGA